MSGAVKIGKTLVLLVLLCSGLQLHAQTVQWTAFADLPDSLRRAPKPVLLFIHTDWCKYCALQDHNTFQNKQVSEKINGNFYALRLNAESRDALTFLNRSYEGAQDGYHELAEMLAKKDGQVIFPTTILLSEKLQLRERWSGFVSPTVLMPYLQVPASAP